MRTGVKEDCVHKPITIRSEGAVTTACDLCGGDPMCIKVCRGVGNS